MVETFAMRNIRYGAILGIAGAGVSVGVATESPIAGVAAAVSVFGLIAVFANVAQSVCAQLETAVRGTRNEPTRVDGPRSPS